MIFSTRLRAAKHYQRGLAKATACGLLLALPACRIPCLETAAPAPAVPDVYPAGSNWALAPDAAIPFAAVVGGVGVTTPPPVTVSPDNSAQLGVAEFYNDPTLTDLVAQAMAGNRELKILEQEVVLANYEVQARRGAIFPFVTAGIGGGFDRSSKYTREGAVEDQLTLPTGRFPDPLGNSRATLDFTWEIDIWRRLRNARDAARQRYLAAVERRNAFVTRLVADVAQNYYQLMALDKRMENLDRTIQLQEDSRQIARAKFEAGRGTELAVQRFLAEVRRNQGEKQVVAQEIVEAENRINLLANHFPQPVARAATGFYDLTVRGVSVGLPSQLLLNRPDIRRAERELAAAGLEVKVARAAFFPSLTLDAAVGYEAFNPRYLFSPETFVANVAGSLVAPLVNRSAIKAAFGSANARQLQAMYDYQRTVLGAFTEVVNRVAMAENYRRSIELRRQQIEALVASVDAATRLFQNPRLGAESRIDYLEVLTAQRDLLEARAALIEAKRQQLTAIVNAYQAIGGGTVLSNTPR